MSAPAASRVLPLLLMVAAAGVGCRGAAAPTGPGQSTGFIIAGPASVAPGATATFRALELHANGTSVDVSAQVTWRSQSPDVLSIQANGVARGVGRGEAAIVAVHRQSTALWPVLVLEDGTFVLTGRVMEKDSWMGWIHGATVEVVRGIGAGLTARTMDVTGSFAIYGVAGAIQVAVSADAYETATVAIDVTQPHHQTISITPVDTPRGSLSGEWELTLLSPACVVPPAMPRQFGLSADLLQTGATRLVATLGGESVVSRNRLVGYVDGGDLVLPLPYWPGDAVDGPSYSLVLAPSWDTIVGIRGVIRALPAGTSAIGIFEGSMDYWGEFGLPPAVCEGTSTVTLRRAGSPP